MGLRMPWQGDDEPYPEDFEAAYTPPPVLTRAPASGDNEPGPRVFLYMAELDILGWKFAVRGNGNIVIEVPGGAVIEANDAHRVLLQALLQLPDGQATEQYSVAPDSPGRSL